MLAPKELMSPLWTTTHSPDENGWDHIGSLPGELVGCLVWETQRSAPFNLFSILYAR
jgi:hypothetical protein